jgi:hypothetical protein
MLRSSPGGRSGMAAMVKRLPDKAGQLEPRDFMRFFPALPREDPRSLEKWWAVTLAKLSTMGDFRMLSPRETDERLEELLVVETQMGADSPITTHRLEDWRDFIHAEGLELELERVSQELAHLSVSCNPLYTPVIYDYIGAVQTIASKEERRLEKLDQSLAELTAYREVLLEKSGDIEDYLNWYEATQVEGISGAFDEYLRIAREPLEIYRMREDRITRYLNALEYERAVRHETTQETQPMLRDGEVFGETAPTPQGAASREF